MATWRAVAQRYWPEYLFTVFLFILVTLISIVGRPDKRLLDKVILEEIGFPFEEKHVPDWVLGTFGWMIPLLVMIVAALFGALPALRTHHHCISFLNSYLVAILISYAGRFVIGRPRPDLLHRCFEGAVLEEVLNNFDANFVMSPYTTAFEPQCTASKESVDMAYTSFPSSQAAIGGSSGFYATLYLVHIWGVFGGQGHSYQAILSLLPVALGMWLSALPFTAYAQHASDAVAGFVLGAAIGIYCFYSVHSAKDDTSAAHLPDTAPLDSVPPTQPAPPLPANGNAGAAASTSNSPDQEVQMQDMYAAAEIAKAGKRNPFA
eukprot:jgi/Ulvmu1/12452/UM009_0104.1